VRPGRTEIVTARTRWTAILLTKRWEPALASDCIADVPRVCALGFVLQISDRLQAWRSGATSFGLCRTDNDEPDTIQTRALQERRPHSSHGYPEDAAFRDDKNTRVPNGNTTFNILDSS